MSIQIQSGSNTFLRTTLASIGAQKFPVTFGFFVKYDAVFNAKTIAAAGTLWDLSAFLIKRDWDSQHQWDTNSGSAAVIAETATNYLVQDVWYYTAVTRTSDTDGTLYIGQPGGSMTEIQVTDAVGAWNDLSDWAISLGGGDLQLAGGYSIQGDFRAAEIALWDRVLSAAELGEIKEGASPSDYPANLLAHWGVETTVEAEALADQTANNNPLVIYKQDATPGQDTVPVLFIADHPTIVSGTSVSATLVQDDIDTPYANKTGLHYTLSSGAGVGAQAYIMTGTDGTTDAAGVITLNPPGVSAGDKLILNVYNPTGSDIHAVDTVVLIGSVQVQ